MKKTLFLFFIVLLFISCQTDYIPKKFAVTFDSDGGTQISSQEIEEGNSAQKPEDPEKDDYDFVGWYNGESLFDFSTPISSPITLKAKWSVKTYTVTFDSDGGSEIATKNIEIHKTLTKPEDPTKETYEFLGWYIDESLFDFSTSITSNITLKAKWNKQSSQTVTEEQKKDSTVVTSPSNENNNLPQEINNKNSTSETEEQIKFFTVTFDSNRGSEINSQIIENGKTASKPEEPYRERYTFIGWFLDEKKYDFSTPITTDITLKAKWDGDVFIVSFDSNGGSEINDQYIYKYGIVTRPTNPKKDSCSFAGWFLGDKQFQFNTTQITEDITLKAKWSQIFTVTFDSDGGTIIINKPLQILDGKTITKPMDPSKDNYTFLGWYNENTEFDFTTPVTSDLVLKAKWEKKLKVTFDYNGIGSNIEKIVDKGSLVASQTASWSKHKFLGWYNGDTLFDFSTPIISDITLTAKWVKLFTVKFDYNDADHNIETKEVEEGQLITDVPNKSKQSGYTLKRWMLNDTVFDFENTSVTTNITLKAEYYRDSFSTNLTMKNGWNYDTNSTLNRYPIVEAVIKSRKGKLLDSNSIIRKELTYPNEKTNPHGSYTDHDVKFTKAVLGTFSNEGHKFAFWLDKENGDYFSVSKQEYGGYESKYSIVDVKRDSEKTNNKRKNVDVISIYIDVDF